MKGYWIWIALFCAAQGILTVIQYFLRKKEKKTRWRVLVIVFKALLAIGCAALVMAGPVFLRPVQVPLVALYAVLLPDASADALYSIVCKLRKKERRFVPFKVLAIVLGVLFFVYGTINMQVVTPEYHTFTSEKLQSKHKVVFVSDLHVGSSQRFATTKKVIAAIGAEKPDCVILGGDITDDYTTKAEMKQTYRLFGAIGVPIYYIDGNHEVVQHAEYIKGGLPYSYEELRQAIEESGIVFLQDEFVTLDADLTLLGREDAASDARKDAAALTNPAPQSFLLTADHQPMAKDAAAVNADLLLCGHTHAGQLFPLKLLYSVIGKVYGEYSLDNGGKMLVSAGASGWRAPFRTDAHCHYEVVTLAPAQ